MGYDWCLGQWRVVDLFMYLFSTCVDKHYLSVVVVNVDFQFMSVNRSILMLLADVDVSRLLLVDPCCFTGLC